MKLSNTGSGKGLLVQHILGDPGGDSGGEGTSKRAGKKYNGAKKSKERHRTLLFFGPFFSAVDFPSTPLSAPGSPRMGPAFRSFLTKIQHPAFFKKLSQIPLFFPKNNKIKFKIN